MANIHEAESLRPAGVEGQLPRDDSFSVYETVLNLNNSMGRLEERSKAQGEQLAKVSGEVQGIRDDILKAKSGFNTACWILSGFLTLLLLVAGFIGWLIDKLIDILAAGPSI